MVADTATTHGGWARKQQVDRPHLNKVLAGQRQITPAIPKKLKIKTVYVRDN